MFEYFFLIIWHVGKPKEPKKGTLKILPQNLNPPPGGPLCIAKGTTDQRVDCFNKYFWFYLVGRVWYVWFSRLAWLSSVWFGRFCLVGLVW